MRELSRLEVLRIVCWLLTFSVLVALLWGLQVSPAPGAFSDPSQFARLVPVVLTVPLLLIITIVLFTRERQVNASEQRSTLLHHVAPGGLILADESGAIQYANPASPPLLGYPDTELAGLRVNDLVSESSQTEFTSLLQAAVPDGAAAHVRLLGRRRDGGEATLEVTVQSATVLGRRINGFYFQDVSEKAELVTALAGRAAQLARSNRDLEQFAYVASHDLQEPIRMVGSYTQLLQQRYGAQLDADANEFLAFAQQGAARMRELVDDLLTYARLDSRARSFERVSMETVLATALATLRPAIAESGATVTHGPLPEVEGDRVQLGQVLQNLVGNALKFRGAQSPHIQIEAARNGDEWIFSVRDDGLGIAPEYQERIFVIFQRLHTREEYPGSGIGLAVCKKVVERHGGRIWVESAGRAGEGSAFHFTLPSSQRPPTPPKLAAPSPAEDRLRRQAQSLIEERLRDLV
ncbi:MAG: ATP-binding protein [Thermoplasmata archaeon]|nr:ATP-binding protein [Thermoplasmata archaeon]